MKKIFNILLAVAMSAAALSLSSCKDETLDPDNPGGTQTDPSTFPDPLDHSSVAYPIAWTPYVVEQGADGVSIEVTSLSEKDFTFVCRPGSAVKSFKVCAFPLSGLYNHLINLNWDAGITAEAVEEILRSYLHEGSSGAELGYVGGADLTYNIEGEDDNEIEIVWSEAGYTFVPPIVPDAEYLILALAYYEKDAQTQAGLSICYVRTPHRPLVGNPDIEIDIQPAYGGFILDYAPMSADAAAFYEFTGVKSEIEAYIDAFGEKTFTDYLRNMMLQDAYPFDGIENPFPMPIELTAEQAADAMAAAVAVDVNGTPGELRTADVSVKEIPENAQIAEATVTVDQNHIGSLVFWLSADMDEYTSEVDIRHYTKAEWDSKFANDKEARKALIPELKDEGWVIQNPNFKYDDSIMEAQGEGAEVPAYRIDMKDILPDTEYVIAYIAVNYFGEADDVHVTAPFKTKPRNVTDPSKFNGNFKVEIVDGESPIGITVKFTYDPEDVAAYYWQVVAPIAGGQGGLVPGYPLLEGDKLDWENTTHEQWIKYYFEAEDSYGNPLCNIWFYNWDDLVSGTDPLGNPVSNSSGTTVLNDDGTVTDQWTYADMVPGTLYSLVAAPEDWDGNVGETKLYEGTTAALNPGPNPEVQMTAQKYTDGSGFTVIFNPVKEVGRMLVMQATTSNELSVTWSPADLVNGTVKENGYSKEEVIGALRAAVLGDVEEDSNNTGGVTYYTMTEMPYTGTEPCITMCIPVGADGSTPVYGELLYVIYDGHEIHYDVADFL